MMATYATVAELNEHLPAAQAVDTGEADEVAEAERLLARASELVDDAVRARYSTDSSTLLPTDDDVIAALRLAVCCQYEQWLEVGEENAVDGLAGTQLAVTGYSGLRAPALAPRAFAALKAQGLTQPVAAAERRPIEAVA